VNFEGWFETSHPGIPIRSAHAVLKLVAEEATVPFIARYRKEQTGNLDEVQIQTVIDAKEYWDQVLKRQAFIVEEIDHQKKLTPELKEKLLSTFSLDLLEDLYLPYKKKKQTKAAIAKDAGLEPLADWIWNCGHGTETPQPGQTLELWAFTFRNELKGINDAAAAIQGAQDILVERLSEMQDLRQGVRSQTFEQGHIRTAKGEKAKPNSKFENYFSYSEAIESLRQPQNSHRYLALKRGWVEEELTLSIGGKPGETGYDERLLAAFEAAACSVGDSPGAAVLLKAARLSLKAHVLPSIENEVHKTLKEVADDAAIRVFAENVRKLLLASPFGPKAVLGIDPGIRTGCKVAVVDDAGKFIANTVIQLQSEEDKKKASKLLSEVVVTGSIRAVAIGNGTAGRETEAFVRATFKEAGIEVPVVMVNEAGASVYSASEAAREEFPDLDVTVRGAISIARRLQDPLAELVKIDPKSIGVGQYQHDVNPGQLKKSLDQVVDSCVNGVGVNLNTASYHLLAHVSGIGPSLAKAIVEFRSKNGLFKSRNQLQEITRFTKKAFEQAAGFLRIPGAENPLDNTGVHPERYPVIENFAKKASQDVKDLLGPGVKLLKEAPEFKEELGPYTFEDVIQELEKPGRDPREEFVPFQYREDIHEVRDLKGGMICPGIVTNVTNFGAFVDIGVHQDGLVHISQLSGKFVKDPRDVVSPGDRVKVRVLEVNLDKNQISLSMKNTEEAPKPRPRPQPSQQPLPRGNGKDSRPRIHARPQGGGGGSGGGPSKRPKPTPKPAFNNPFGGLASLRNSLKPGSK
jgi:protein Tex